MVPWAPPLPKSESKKTFMLRVGLDESKMRDRRIYDCMKREASDGRDRIIRRIEIADPTGAMNTSPLGPDGEAFYPSSYIGDQAITEESYEIMHRASAETRAIYIRGHDPDRPHDPNWIIRWCLWHVFRYRDGRQARQKMANAGRPSGPVALLRADDAWMRASIAARRRVEQRFAEEQWTAATRDVSICMPSYVYNINGIRMHYDPVRNSYRA